jgi:cyclopropane-fatty-acyl-phospholipid synthase
MIDFLLNHNLVPDFLIRQKIRKLNEERLSVERGKYSSEYVEKFIQDLKSLPIAIETKSANEQHYEVPADFFKLCLGEHLKYSCCYWINANDNLNTAEENMLKLTCERADLIDGLSILELGCGWGAISLWMAKTYPNSKITSVSNSESQKEYIYKECETRGITNLEVITADMNVFQTEKKFDRVVSVEMFEHMKNYDILLNKISNWLKDNGKLFVHIFTHKNFSYHFETEGKNDWMGKYFFTGGIMPSHNLLDHFNNDLKIVKNWIVDGTHYHRTAESWLDNMDQNKDKISDIFKLTYGRNHTKWRVYWRIFFMACSELWKTSNGNEWQVSHYLFKKK